MAALVIHGRDDLLSLKAVALGCSPWVLIDQRKIDAFADATDDHAWIHVDTERARQGMPDGKTIAHGFLSLSLLPRMIDSLIQIEGSDKAFNYGMDGLRFLAPLPSGSRIRLNCEVLSAEPRGARDVKVVYRCSVEVEGQERLALAGEWIALYLF